MRGSNSEGNINANIDSSTVVGRAENKRSNSENDSNGPHKQASYSIYSSTSHTEKNFYEAKAVFQIRVVFFSVGTLTNDFFSKIFIFFIKKRRHTCKILHVRRLDVNYVKALITHFQVPKIYSQIISRNVCLAITK